MRGPGGIIPPGGVQGRRPCRAQLIHRCKIVPGETGGAGGAAPCPCPNTENPAWNRDRGLAISHMRKGSGTEANLRANLSRRQGVKPTSPGERQPQRDSFQICAPSCRSPKNERFLGDVAAVHRFDSTVCNERRCGCLKPENNIFRFQDRSRVSGAPSLARRELYTEPGFYSTQGI